MRIKGLKKIVAAAAIIAAMAGLAGCGGGGNSDGSTDVNIGYFNNVTHAQA